MGVVDHRHSGANIFVRNQLLAEPRMMMAFLLVVVVEGEQLPQKWFFKNITRCNTFAYYISTGKMAINNTYQIQTDVTAYCIPQTVPTNTKTWD